MIVISQTTPIINHQPEALQTILLTHSNLLCPQTYGRARCQRHRSRTPTPTHDGDTNFRRRHGGGGGGGPPRLFPATQEAEEVPQGFGEHRGARAFQTTMLLLHFRH